MNRKMKTVGAFLIGSLLFTSCGVINGRDSVLQKPSQAETAYTTAIQVDGHDLILGMSDGDSFFNPFLLDELDASSGIVCDHIEMQSCWVLDINDKWSVEVMGEQARISAYFAQNLQELLIAWNDRADEAVLWKKLTERFGENYTMDTIFYAGYQSAYRWDLSDGTSIFFLPMEETLSQEYRDMHFRWNDEDTFFVGPCLIMAPTNDITEIQIPGEE